MNRESIITKEPFEGLFPIDVRTLKAVEDNMRENGYDQGVPITVWKGKRICIDGHTRLIAAETVGIEDIPAFGKHFENEDEALQYAIHCQRDRRNMTGADIAKCVNLVDKLKERGGDHKSEEFQESKLPSESIDPEESAEVTAKIVGTSKSKVNKIRYIDKHADDETKEALAANEITINKAYTQAKDKKGGMKPVRDLNERDPKEILETQEFKKAYELFFGELLNAREMKWKTTSKEMALKRINALKQVAS